MKKWKMLLAGIVVCLAIATNSYADQTIVAQKVASAPVIDGGGTDSVWAQAIEYTTYDEVAKMNMTLKAVYTNSEVFFLVSFPDPDKNITHKTWTWDKTKEMYITGNNREDCFVFKWNMEQKPVDLSVKADNEYMTDIWFWKACRTDPAGYSDDKHDRLSATAIRKTTKVISKTGKTMYLERKPDSGTTAFKDVIYSEYKGDKMPHYEIVVPTGSLADIKAKGVWSKGRWTLEFGRALNTGNSDDVQFDISKSYLFGVSRYEISGLEPDPKLDQPLYESGDVSEALTLQFGK